MSISHDHRVTFASSAAGFLLAGTAVVIAIVRPLWLATVLVGPAGQAVTFFASVLAAALVATAVVFLVRERMRGGIPVVVVVLATALVGLAAMGLAALSFSIGFDEADAGAARSTFGSLGILFLAGAVLMLTASITTLALSILGSPAAGRRGRDLLTFVVSIATAVMVAAGAIFPVSVALAGCAVFVVTVLLVTRSRRGLRAPGDATTATSAVDRQRWADASRPAVLLARGALVAAALIWGTGLAASIALVGQPGATTALGIASALGQLPAIPLLWCVTVIFVTRMPASATAIRSVALLASVAIASSGVGLAVAGRPDGVLLFNLMPVLGLAVGVWSGSIVFALLHRFTPLERWIVAIVLTLGVAFAYNAVVTMNGGIPLLLAGAVLAFWGARAALRPRDAASGAGLSPATFPVSG